jgi:HEAT repeat protein
MTTRDTVRIVWQAALMGLCLQAAAGAATPAGLRGSAIEVRAAGGDLDAALRAAAGQGPAWVAWSVPVVAGQGEACCYNGSLQGEGARRRGCRLDGRDHGVSISSDERTGGDADGLAIYARFDHGVLERVRAYTADCPVEAGGARLVWLEDVQPAQSVARLASEVRARPPGKGAGDDALVALALHADPGADAVLIELAGRGTPMALREDAIFWLGQARGERGYRELARMTAQESDPRVLEKIAFSLSQCPLPAAGATLEELALRHRDARVRQEALFWLGQRADAGIAAKLLKVAQQDADLEVRKKAVFALSQLDDGEGVTPLLELVRHGREIEVRREALFWLGQSDDPRAMESLEALLLKR